jgi:hypothetical protein
MSIIPNYPNYTNTPNFPNYTITPMSPITSHYTPSLYCVHASMHP